MTPKEKAEELVNKFTHDLSCDVGSLSSYQAKQCALIAVGEIILIQQKTTRILSDTVVYWQEVKQEIERL